MNCLRVQTDVCDLKDYIFMGRKALDLTGVVSGSLVVIRRVEGKDKQNSYWLCKCSCGKEIVVSGINIKSGNSKNCGCFRLEKSKTMGGESSTKEYKCWMSIKSRCYSPGHRKYHLYGGRGIKMCDAWLDDYFTFLSDVGRAPSPDLTLDRIDCNKGYEPDNVRWTSYEVQNNNRRDYNVVVTVNGETGTVSQLARKFGLKISTVFEKIRRGCPPEQAFLELVDKKRVE